MTRPAPRRKPVSTARESRPAGAGPPRVPGGLPEGIPQDLARRILGRFGLAPEPPSREALERVHRAFVLSVPFENLTKILKADGPGPASRKLRLPEELFKGFLERRSGGTCFARTFAYRALLRAIGYESSLHLGGVRGPGDHACTLVNVDGARVLSDVGFPLLGTAQLGPGPVVVRFPAYDFRVEPDRRRGRGKVGGLRSRSAPAAGVDPPAFLVTRIGPDGESPFFAFEAQPASLEAFERCWQRTFRKGAPFLGAVTAVRHEPDRIVRLQGREIVYRTRRGETRLPLRGEIPRKLSRVFGFSPDLVAEALLRRPL